MDVSLLKKPSAVIPLVISFAALTLVLVGRSLFNGGDEIDVPNLTRVFRIVLAAQIPLVLFFLYKWLPRKPNEALRVLALQAAAALLALVAGFML
jgi:uncharacterized BrkB/YihY/UPF0761 family membrane protein